MDVEILEPRRFFSVTVTPTSSGVYEITGDASDDVITVSVNQATSQFTMDGQTYDDAQYLMVDGGAGDDTISVTSSDPADPVMVAAAISGGDGNDDITLNFDGGVWGGNGDDTIRVSDSFYGSVYGEAGNDHMIVSGNCYGATIDGGDDNDFIDCSGNNFAVVVNGGNGADTIIGSEYDDQISGDAGADSVVGGGGDDSFNNADSTDTIDGGAGADTVYAYGATPTMTNIEQVY